MIQARLLNPRDAGRYNHWQRIQWNRAKPGVSSFPQGGMVFSTLVFGLPGVLLGSLVAPLFFLFVLVPVLVIGGYVSFMRHSTLMPVREETRGYRTCRGLYSSALGEFYKIWDHDTKDRARDLLENVWSHERALLKIGQSHWEADCDSCRRRIELIKRFSDAQSLPGTLTHDIETAEEWLDAKLEITSK